MIHLSIDSQTLFLVWSPFPTDVSCRCSALYIQVINVMLTWLPAVPNANTFIGRSIKTHESLMITHSLSTQLTCLIPYLTCLSVSLHINVNAYTVQIASLPLPLDLHVAYIRLSRNVAGQVPSRCEINNDLYTFFLHGNIKLVQKYTNLKLFSDSASMSRVFVSVKATIGSRNKSIRDNKLIVLLTPKICL